MPDEDNYTNFELGMLWLNAAICDLEYPHKSPLLASDALSRAKGYFLLSEAETVADPVAQKQLS